MQAEQFPKRIMARFNLTTRWETWKKPRCRSKAMLLASMLLGRVPLREFYSYFSYGGQKDDNRPDSVHWIRDDCVKVMKVLEQLTPTQEQAGAIPRSRPATMKLEYWRNWYQVDGFVIVFEQCPKTKRCVL